MDCMHELYIFMYDNHLDIYSEHTYQDYCNRLGVNDDLVAAVLAGKKVIH